MKVFNNILNKNRCRILLAAFTISFLISAPHAQPTAAIPQSSENRIALYQALLDLTNLWTVMCVAAHPDDEDGTSLIVMRRKHGAHTVSLFSTFGEGGQNAIGPELYEKLGAIRARETMAASEIQGSDPHFLGLKDFGFSKSAEETFQKWGHGEALRRMVLQIRKLRPDVIITNHSITSNDHGHHQATARLVVEAFDAAADPKRFPEQLKNGIEVWQVQRLFVRLRGSQAPPADAQLLTIDPNERDPVRGTVFAEQALAALQKHATQGPWPKTFAEFTARFRAFSGQAGASGQMPLIRYRLAREAKSVSALPDNASTFYAGLKLPAEAMETPSSNGRPLVDFINDPSKVRNELIKFASEQYRSASDLSINGRPSFMRDRLARATELAAGADLQITTSNSPVIPGAKVVFSIQVRNHSTEPLFLFGCHSEIPASRVSMDQSKIRRKPSSGSISWRISPGASFLTSTQVAIPPNAPVNIPFSEHLYEPTGLGVMVNTRCVIGLGSSARFAIKQNVRIDVAPAVEIAEIMPSLLVLTPGTQPVHRHTSPPNKIYPTYIIKVRLINHGDGPVAVKMVDNTGGVSAAEVLPARGAKTLNEFPSSAYLWDTPRTSLPKALILTARRQRTGVPVTTRSIPLSYADARNDRLLRIGYIRGFDYSLPNALDALGVESKELGVDEVKTADLSKYTSIIVDNRVYESQPELVAANQRLLDYAKAGGNLIVFYHKNDEWNLDARRNRPQLAPYKLILGNERITVEDAPITFLEPQHPLLNTPNKLGPEDFVGWIQERGLYYPREWDSQFKALLQSNDPGEAPLKGGLLVADYGKGHYIYTSMVWYRQLRAGVPGAYRMLANMISYGHEK